MTIKINSNIFKGFVPSVQTFGIITALNDELEKILKAGNFGYIKGKSDYGKFERPFFIPNINKTEILRLGFDFKQESVIYGEKLDGDNYDGMNIYLLFSDKNERIGKIDSEAKIFLNTDRNQFFTEKAENLVFHSLTMKRILFLKRGVV